MQDLIRYGEDYERFWFTKKHFEELQQTFLAFIKQNVKQSITDEENSTVAEGRAQEIEDKINSALSNFKISPVASEVASQITEVFSRIPSQLSPAFSALQKGLLNSQQGPIEKGKEQMNAEIKAYVEAMEDKIKEANERFIEDLKETREELKENLRGRFYRLKVGINFFLKYVPLLTFVVLVFDLQAPDKFNEWVVSVVSDFFRQLFRLFLE